jgi:hypothetical protein
MDVVWSVAAAISRMRIALSRFHSVTRPSVDVTASIVPSGDSAARVVLPPVPACAQSKAGGRSAAAPVLLIVLVDLIVCRSTAPMFVCLGDCRIADHDLTELRIMTRLAQGVCIILGSIVATVAVLAAAVAWGPHHCELVFPKIIGCAMGNYEGLAGGMIAAAAALLAGWLAWSGVQVQIAAEERRAAAEERRAAADRVEVERVLQGDLNIFAEGLVPAFKGQ